MKGIRYMQYDSFQYLFKYIEQCRGIDTIPGHESFLDNAGDKELEILSCAANDIIARKDEARLGQWLGRPIEPVVRRLSRHEQEKLENEWALQQFLYLLMSASRRQLISALEISEDEWYNYDWSVLPKDLADVGRVAARFATVNVDNVDEMLSPSDRSFLRRFAEYMRKSGYGRQLERWIGESESREASLCYQLLGVLDALGLEWT